MAVNLTGKYKTKYVGASPAHIDRGKKIIKILEMRQESNINVSLYWLQAIGCGSEGVRVTVLLTEQAKN